MLAIRDQKNDACHRVADVVVKTLRVINAFVVRTPNCAPFQLGELSHHPRLAVQQLDPITVQMVEELNVKLALAQADRPVADAQPA